MIDFVWMIGWSYRLDHFPGKASKCVHRWLLNVIFFFFWEIKENFESFAKKEWNEIHMNGFWDSISTSATMTLRSGLCENIWYWTRQICYAQKNSQTNGTLPLPSSSWLSSLNEFPICKNSTFVLTQSEHSFHLFVCYTIITTSYLNWTERRKNENIKSREEQQQKMKLNFN